LIVIPARGNSKGIPKKNIRRIGDKPLIAYTIEKAIKLKKINKYIEIDIIVSSDDKHIEEYVSIYDEVKFIKRPDELAEDDTPLDPVVYHSYKNSYFISKYDFIITLVPTMPILSYKTMNDAIQKFIHDESESLILVNDATHIYWQNNEPITERKNRQFIEPIYQECGGIIITSESNLRKTRNILTERPYLYVCPPDEAVDVNNWYDIILAEKLLNRKKIGFRVGGTHKKGMGHVYRCLNLALRFIEHEIYFFIEKKDGEAIDAVDSYFFKRIEYDNINDLLIKIDKNNIDVIINDTLGIEKELGEYLRIPIIGLDEKEKKYCDLTINPQIEFSNSDSKNIYGYKYSVIREDVLIFPIKKCPLKIDNILITMGGSDPENVTLKIMNYLKNYKKVNVIIGKYFSDSNKEKIYEFDKKNNNFNILNDVKFMGKHLYESDLVISSNSSTVYDCVALGTFVISIDKVKQEMHHIFSNVSEAVKYLGYHDEIKENVFLNAVNEFLFKHDSYHEYYDALVKYANEIRKGQKIIKDKINEVIEK